MYQGLLNQIAEKLAADGSALQPPCSAESLAQLRTMARSTLSVEIPNEYARFLAITNGLDWNGLMIYASMTCPIVGVEESFIEGFVEANYLWRDYAPNGDYLVFGESGLSKYVYRLADSTYWVLDRSSGDSVKSYESFDEMMGEALENHR